MGNDERIGDSARLAMWYRDVPLSLEMLKMLEGKVSNECWKYLLGKFCLAEKGKRRENEQVKEVYMQIGKEFGFTYTNMKDYIDYAHAIDKIHSLRPCVSEDILNGESRIGQKATVMFAKLDFHEMGEVIARLSTEKTAAKFIIAEQKALRTKTKRPGRPKLIKNNVPRASVKDTPAFDPDAQMNGLTYTIPSWVSLLERFLTVSDMSKVSTCSRDKLAVELHKLKAAAETATALLLEESDGYGK